MTNKLGLDFYSLMIEMFLTVLSVAFIFIPYCSCTLLLKTSSIRAMKLQDTHVWLEFNKNGKSYHSVKSCKRALGLNFMRVLLKEQCHEDFAVLGQFCAKITTVRL